MNERSVIYSWSQDDQLEIYVKQSSGNSVFLTTHRFNPTLYGYLRNGCTVQQLRRFRPKRNKGEQKIANAVKQILAVFDWLVAEEVA